MVLGDVLWRRRRVCLASLGGADLVAEPRVPPRSPRGGTVGAILLALALALAAAGPGLICGRGPSRGTGPRGPGERGRSHAPAASTDPAQEPPGVGPVQVGTFQAQKLLYLMSANPELFDFTLEAELEALAKQRGEQGPGPPGADGDELQQRMSEVRDAERSQVVTELLYASVCNRFRTLGVRFIPPVKEGGDAYFDAIDLSALTTGVHSKEAMVMVREHLLKTTGQQLASIGIEPPVQIAVLLAGEAYIMSVVHGFMVRRADERFRLEKLMGGSDGSKELRDYFDSFAATDLRKLGPLISEEAQRAVQAQVIALFGDLSVLKEKMKKSLSKVSSNQEEMGKLLVKLVESGEIESVKMPALDLKRLVLEGTAFGALLFECERRVDDLYKLTPADGEVSFR